VSSVLTRPDLPYCRLGRNLPVRGSQIGTAPLSRTDISSFPDSVDLPLFCRPFKPTMRDEVTAARRLLSCGLFFRTGPPLFTSGLRCRFFRFLGFSRRAAPSNRKVRRLPDLSSTRKGGLFLSGALLFSKTPPLHQIYKPMVQRVLLFFFPSFFLEYRLPRSFEDLPF